MISVPKTFLISVMKERHAQSSTTWAGKIAHMNVITGPEHHMSSRVNLRVISIYLMISFSMISYRTQQH